MASVISNEGLLKSLSEFLASGEDWLLCLFGQDITPAPGDVAAAYLAAECSFSGYSRKTLTRSLGSTTWGTPTLAAPSGSPPWTSRGQVAKSLYNATSPIVYTCGPTGGTVYGYFLIGAQSGLLRRAERFSPIRPLAPDDTLTLPPSFEM